MDIDKLIEQLSGYFEGKDLKRGVALDAATAKAMYGIRLCYIFKADDVGRTVFLTREAAEEALKAREQE